MNYKNVIPARFLERPNRFIARVELGGGVETVHVKNTGRCRELLIPGAEVWLAGSDNPERKTKYDLVTVRRGGELVNIDSQAANDVAAEWLALGHIFGENAVIRREVVQGGSRFDFRIDEGGRTSFLEVKGVTLERDGIAYFPDAPTERGIKHLRELADCASGGYGAYLLFVVQMTGVCAVRPNDGTHAAFGAALREAAGAGVRLMAVDCAVTADSVAARHMLPVEL
ncbi:MAG: DNA/RNA nuclease SfsA [Clostridia bacterium]|nr:DNA/RNA nuclease SfsA [Clostridia bacterium]